MKIATIICTKGRTSVLFNTLVSLRNQSKKSDYVIIVDDNETQSVEPFIPKDYIYIHRDPITTGLAEARNVGLNYVPDNTDIIIFLDDDVYLQSGYLESLLKEFEVHPEIDGMSGQFIKGYYQFPTWKKIILLIIGCVLPPLVPVSMTGYVVKLGGATTPLFVDKNPSVVEWLSGSNMAYRKSVFENHAFDESMVGYCMGEDVLFSYKLFSEGKLLGIARNARIEHRSEESNNPTLKQLIMIFAYRRYVLQNIVENKLLSKLYYQLFSLTYIISAIIHCVIGKRKWGYFWNSTNAYLLVAEKPDINEINKHLVGGK